MTGLPFAFSAHAKDIYTTPEWDLSQKIAEAAWGTTCTSTNRDVLNALADRPRHGGTRLPRPRPAPFAASPRRGAGGKGPFASSRCAARWRRRASTICCARSPGSTGDWRFEHIGGGALVARLKALAERLGIADRVLVPRRQAPAARSSPAYAARRRLRAGEPYRQERRPRRAAQRHHGGDGDGPCRWSPPTCPAVPEIVTHRHRHPGAAARCRPPSVPRSPGSPATPARASAPRPGRGGAGCGAFLARSRHRPHLPPASPRRCRRAQAA